MLEIQNNGSEIISTNYYDSEYALKGRRENEKIYIQ